MDRQTTWSTRTADARCFSAVAGVSSHGVAACDGNNLLHCNSAFARLIGADQNHLIGQPLDSLFVPEVRTLTLRRLHELQQAHVNDSAFFSTRLLRQDDAEIDVEVSVFDATFGGTCDRIVVFRPIVTELPSGMDQSGFTQLVRLHQMSIWGELAASLLHELGQPLTAARGACEILNQTLQLSPESQKTMEMLWEAVKTAIARFQETRSFIRSRQLQFETISLSTIAANAIRTLHRIPVLKTANVSIQATNSVGARIRADPKLLELAIVNLIRTSLSERDDRMEPTSEVRVSVVRPSKTRAEVRIAHRRSFTEPDSPEMVPTAEPAEGDEGGLTLSVCRTIIEQNHGVLAVERFADLSTASYRIVFPLATET